ncbi:ATP-binding protein [Streptomyces sp. NPDC008317]|uniref:sensor histidine kinase n=1 Tax=Streptomyces sp. NPDC008317 TaxID=3364827 RepID=UPI0036EEE543
MPAIPPTSSTAAGPTHQSGAASPAARFTVPGLSRFRRTRTRPRSLAGQLFAVQVVIVALVVGGCAVLAYVNAGSRAEDAARDRVSAAATAVADSDTVVRAARSADPTAALQPYADRVTADAGVDFVTIMDTHGIRWTHPDRSLIGKHFLGHIGPALRGQTFTETYTGSLGASVRVVTPVRSGDRIVALVSVGIKVDTISQQVRKQLTALVAVALAALVVGGLGTYAANRRLRTHTHGMAATELSRMYDYHQATLHALREGLVLLDADRRVALCNDAARELLSLGEQEVVGRYVDTLGLPVSLTGALLAAEPRVDEVHLTSERVVVVNTSPVRGGERRGTVVTLRDHTDLQALTGELDSVRGFAEALRSQAHESSNRLHTVVSLIELGRAQEAVDFATSELELAQALTDRVVAAVGEPVLAALLLGKAAESHERGVELTVTEDSRIDDGVLPPALTARDLVTVLGNLIDNAIDAAIEGAARGGGRPSVTVRAKVEEDELLLKVTDSGRGVDPATIREVFRRGWTTKSEGHGLGLALVEQAARRAGGRVGLDRAEGGGAEFTVRLPLGQEARA